MADCTNCEAVALRVAAIHLVIHGLYNIGIGWTDPNFWRYLNGFKLFIDLNGLFLRLWAFGYNMVKITNSVIFRETLEAMLVRFNFNFFNPLKDNVQENLLT